MKILKFNELNNNGESILHYYAFDFDDNLLFMPTTIIVLDSNGEEVEIETHEFAKYRSIIGKEEFDYNGKTIVGFIMGEDGSVDYESSFRNFRDHMDINIFLKDTISAIKEGKYGPSWNDFIECLVSGSLFAIITARGHESPSIRKAVEYIIDECLTEDQKHEMYHHLLKYSYLFNRDTDHDRFYKGKLTDTKLVDEYLGFCEFIGVSAPSRLDPENAMNPEKPKIKALMNFKRKINKSAARVGMKARIGFSDDDNKTVGVIEDLVDNIDHEEFPHIIQWVVKNTNDPNNITKSTRDRN